LPKVIVSINIISLDLDEYFSDSLLVVRISAKESDYFNLNMKYFVNTPPVLNRWYCEKN